MLKSKKDFTGNTILFSFINSFFVIGKVSNMDDENYYLEDAVIPDFADITALVAKGVCKGGYPIGDMTISKEQYMFAVEWTHEMPTLNTEK